MQLPHHPNLNCMCCSRHRDSCIWVGAVGMGSLHLGRCGGSPAWEGCRSPWAAGGEGTGLAEGRARGTCYMLWLAIFYNWRNSIWLQAYNSSPAFFHVGSQQQ